MNRLSFLCVCGVCMYAPHVVTRGAELCDIVYHVSFAGGTTKKYFWF